MGTLKRVPKPKHGPVRRLEVDHEHTREGEADEVVEDVAPGVFRVKRADSKMGSLRRSETRCAAGKVAARMAAAQAQAQLQLLRATIAAAARTGSPTTRSAADDTPSDAR